MVYLLLVIGLTCLGIGAELLVRGASRLALLLGMTPLVVGLTVVAFGTSAPELAVSIMAALKGEPEIALGNVVGSNTFNVLFVLGLSALTAPLMVAQKLMRKDIPIMIGVSFLLYLMALNGFIGRWEGAFLSAGLAAFIVFSVKESRTEKKAVAAEYGEALKKPKGKHPILINSLWVILGLVLLTLGSKWLVQGATTLALAFGLSPLVIGLTIVAGGTSLPEVATSVMAAYRGERDIAIGNVVGSNIFNILCVLGISSLVSPRALAVPAIAIRADIPIMIAAALLCLPIAYPGNKIGRWRGAALLVAYVAYTVYLVKRG